MIYLAYAWFAILFLTTTYYASRKTLILEFYLCFWVTIITVLSFLTIIVHSSSALTSSGTITISGTVPELVRVDTSGNIVTNSINSRLTTCTTCIPGYTVVVLTSE